MPVYEYEAKTLKGAQLKGTLDAVNEDAAMDALREKGYYPTRLRLYKASRNIDISMLQKVKVKDIAIFCRQFSVVINAGISVLRGLEIVMEQTESKRLKYVLEEVFADVQRGRSLSEAMKRHSDFPDMLSDMITVGESSGTLDVIFERMAVYYDKENALSQKIKSAMTYPAAISIFAVSVCHFAGYEGIANFCFNVIPVGSGAPPSDKDVARSQQFLNDAMVHCNPWTAADCFYISCLLVEYAGTTNSGSF